MTPAKTTMSDGPDHRKIIPNIGHGACVREGSKLIESNHGQQLTCKYELRELFRDFRAGVIFLRKNSSNYRTGPLRFAGVNFATNLLNDYIIVDYTTQDLSW